MPISLNWRVLRIAYFLGKSGFLRILCSHSWFLCYNIAVQCCVVVILCFCFNWWNSLLKRSMAFRKCVRRLYFCMLCILERNHYKVEYMLSYAFSYIYFQFEPNRSLELAVGYFLFRPKYQGLLPEFGCGNY